MFTGAYVTQGPRSLKEAPSIGPVAGSPTSTTGISGNIISGSASAPPARAETTPDVSHVSLQLGWSPPTPFSLPATPRQSPFLYPADVPNYEFVDARFLCYDPREWPEFENQMANSRRPQLPLMLDDYVQEMHGKRVDFEGSLQLTSLLMTVHFGTQPSHIEGVTPSLTLGKHQLATLSQDDMRMQRISVGELDATTQDLVQTIQPGHRVCHVDLPIHIPNGAADHAYLTQHAGPEFHIKCTVGFQAGGHHIPHDEELKTVSEVLFFSGQEHARGAPEKLDVYQEVAPMKRSKAQQQAGALVTPGLATMFVGKLWTDSIEQPKAAVGKSKPIASRYAR